MSNQSNTCKIHDEYVLWIAHFVKVVIHPNKIKGQGDWFPNTGREDCKLTEVLSVIPFDTDLKNLVIENKLQVEWLSRKKHLKFHHNFRLTLLHTFSLLFYLLNTLFTLFLFLSLTHTHTHSLSLSLSLSPPLSHISCHIFHSALWGTDQG